MILGAEFDKGYSSPQLLNREIIQKALEDCQDLADTKTALLKLLTEIKSKDPSIKIWFVSGVIAADGEEFKERNRKLLDERTEYIRRNYGLITFSAIDVFIDPLLRKVKQSGAFGDDFTVMWCELLSEGSHLLEGIVSTPRWDISNGCRLERKVAEDYKMKILNLSENLVLEKV